jgi:exodeoxyribonuclease V alpha subunit
MANLPVAEVTGEITRVDFPKSRGDPTTFRIHCKGMGKTFDGVCSFFCPIRTGDTMYAICRIDSTQKLHVALPPFVQPAIDKDSIIQCFMKALKQGWGPACKIFGAASKLAGGDDLVIPYISDLSQKWTDTRLSDILYLFKSVDPDDIKKLLGWWHRERNLRRLYLLDLNKKEINACRLTCEDIYNACTKNPYTLPAIPMDKALRICDRLNMKVHDDERIRGSIVRMIWDNTYNRGWTGTPTRMVIRKYPDIERHMDSLTQDYELVAEDETAYLKFPYTVETYLADIFTKKMGENRVSYDTPIDQKIVLPSGETIERHSVHLSMEMSKDQIAAIQGALDHTLCIVTGSAGTGKTRVLSQILHNLELRNITYAVCSFTGKAVARIREVTKRRNPATMHRLIANSRKDKTAPRVSSSSLEKIPESSEYEHLIIDEASMVTTELMYDFLLAHPNIKKITLIGDVNQLPPIGWGSMLLQLIKSQTIPTYYLTTNFRVYTSSGEKDGIILNANNIITNDDNYPFEFEQTSNFSIIEGPIERAFDIVKGCHAAGVTPDQIVILSPYNQSLEILNKTFQSIYDMGARSVTDSRKIRWMCGDRVMLTENDSEINVFNGETGTVKDVSSKSIIVDFGLSGIHEFLLEPTHGNTGYFQQGTTGSYVKRGKKMDQVHDGEEGGEEDERTVLRLSHAYALSIDKSQGSEWDFVILHIPEFRRGSFLNRKRIYTAITRAKRGVWCTVPDLRLFNEAAVLPAPHRFENLDKRLKAVLPRIKPLIMESENPALEMKGDLPKDLIIPDDYLDYDDDDDNYY